jgi:hypothetical protein
MGALPMLNGFVTFISRGLLAIITPGALVALITVWVPKLPRSTRVIASIVTPMIPMGVITIIILHICIPVPVDVTPIWGVILSIIMWGFPDSIVVRRRNV